MSLYAVAFTTNQQVTADLFYWSIAIFSVAALGLGPIAGWFLSAWKKPMVKRFVMALLLALTLGAGTTFAADYCCCDPFWIIFWLCIAP